MEDLEHIFGKELGAHSGGFWARFYEILQTDVW